MIISAIFCYFAVFAVLSNAFALRSHRSLSALSGKQQAASRARALFAAEWDVVVRTADGVETSVKVKEGVTILNGLLDAGIDAPSSCMAGLCTECAALVIEGRENVELEAAVLDEETTAKGFILTCSSNIKGPVKMVIGVGDAMYDSQYGDIVKGYDTFQKGGKDEKKGRFGGLGDVGGLLD
mgnify:CR=1 FL=1